MDLNKYSPKSKHVPVDGSAHDGGHQWVFRFENGYGASLITTVFAYGGAELAVLRWEGDGDDDWSIDYSTPITSNVLGSLTPETAEEALDQIKALPPHRGVVES